MGNGNFRSLKRRKKLSAADQMRVNQLFELIKPHADSVNGKLLMEVVEPHVMDAGDVAGRDGVDNGVGNGRMDRMTVDEVVAEIKQGIDQLPPDRVQEVKRVYWQGQSNLIARDSCMAFQRTDALTNAKANAAYSAAFADRNKRI